MSHPLTDKQQILLTGGEFDEPESATIPSWLRYVTDTANLTPGLPELTIYFGPDRYCCLKVAFAKDHASLKLFELELLFLDDQYASGIFSDNTLGSAESNEWSNWILKLFQHEELETLTVPFQNLTLPDHFDKLPKLNSADLSNSKLRELPPSFYQLRRLQYLNIVHSGIQEVPATIANFPLRSFSFSQHFQPTLFTQLPNIVELRCFHNAFIVPDEIAQLTQLTSLYIASVSQATDILLHLPKLEKLVIRFKNSSIVLAANPSTLPNLRELDTDNPEIFADILENLKSLERLTLKGKAKTSVIRKIETSLSNLEKLQNLSLEGIGIINLDWCTSLLILEYLDLSSNAIDRIPSGFANLQKLKTLILRKNPIATIPDLSPMPSVTFIDLEGTKIPWDPAASTDLQPAPEELIRLKRIFPNVAYLALM